MATTGMWAVKNRLDHLVNYVSNPYKTIGLETVIDYTTNGEKTIEKRYVTYSMYRNRHGHLFGRFGPGRGVDLAPGERSGARPRPPGRSFRR